MSDNHVIIHEEDCMITVGDEGLYLNCKYRRYLSQDVEETNSVFLTSVKTVSSKALEELKFQAVNALIDQLEAEAIEEGSNP